MTCILQERNQSTITWFSMTSKSVDCFKFADLGGPNDTALSHREILNREMHPRIWRRTTLDRPKHTCELKCLEMVQFAVSGSLVNRHMTRLCEGLYRDVHFHEAFPNCFIEFDTTDSFNCYERDVQIAPCSTFLLHTKSPAYQFGILLHPV